VSLSTFVSLFLHAYLDESDGRPAVAALFALGLKPSFLSSLPSPCRADSLSRTFFLLTSTPPSLPPSLLPALQPFRGHLCRGRPLGLWHVHLSGH